MDIFKHKASPGFSGTHPYVSPFLFEAFSTSTGAPKWTSATGAYTANTGQALSNSGLSTGGYCLGDDGLLHLLGANAVRVEPSGLLIEGDGTNNLAFSTAPAANWSYLDTGGGPVVATDATADVLDPTGANGATKLVIPAGPGGLAGSIIYQTTAAYNGTFSVYLRTAAGTAQVSLVSSSGTDHVLCDVTSTWQRFTLPVTVAGAGVCAIGSYFYALPSSTVYMWGPQSEQTPFASSYIPVPAGTPVARTGDFVTASNPVPTGPLSAGVTATPLLAWTAFGVSPFFFTELLSTYNPQGLDISTGGSTLSALTWGANSHFRSVNYTPPADKSTLVVRMASNNAATPTVTGDVNGSAMTGLSGTGNAIASAGTTIHFGNYVFGDGIIGDGSFWGHLKDVFVNT